MAIQNLFTSRDNTLDGNTYVGQLGRLWYNPDTNFIYASDGNTVGGVPISILPDSNITANVITVNTITSTSGNVAVTGNLVISGNISPAAVGKIGGIIPGPGANVSNTGLLTIDSANVPFSFGNFTADDNLLTIVNSDENMILATQGSAEIQLVGNIGFYKSNGLPPSANNQFFFARDDGQLQILVPAEDPIAGGVEIIGSATGNFIEPGAPGTMLHLTGNPDISCRVYQDTLGNYSSYVARRYNGNTASPTQVLAGQDVFRINTTAATDAGVGNVAMAQVSFTALEDQTTTAQGSSITFTVTPVGSPAASRVDVATITVADGITATQFTTSGNVVANVIVAASAGNINLAGNLIPTANVYTLGAEVDPWQSAYFGPESITIADSTGNVANAVVIENEAGDITMATAGFKILTLDTGAPIFRVAALTGQIYSNAQTIIENTTDAANVTSGSLQTAGGAGIVKNLYVGNNIVATGNITGGNVAGTTFTGNVVGNVTGTATTATNLSAATSILAGSINIDPTTIGKNTTSTQTFTLTGLTTSHKVIVMPQADFSYGLSILAAYPSALNTLSVQFQEQGGATDPPAFDLAYFAWV